MATSGAESWDRLRRTFADQFEQDGSSFVYRRSQKGVAIRVSADERRRFIDEFDQSVRRAKWILYGGVTVLLGCFIGFSLLKDLDMSQAATCGGIGLVMVPYFAYYRWAWAAPSRELGSRTPIAGERPADEVRRLRFKRMTYGQLAGAASGGLMFPFIGSAPRNVFSGWNRLWLVFGGGLVLFAAVQAFRKWRFEQEKPFRGAIPRPTEPDIAEAVDASAPTKRWYWRYLPLAVIVVGFAFVAYTPAGKQFARQPSFFPILMIGFGCWSLLTVGQGFLRGRIEPFARGFYNTYERETQPKRFWASMAWNAILGGFCVWIAFMMNRDATTEPLRDRCYNEGRKYQPQEVIPACSQLLTGKASLGGWSRADVFVDRGVAYADAERPGPAIADYSAAIRLQPNYPEAYHDRALVYEQIGDAPRALNDYRSAIEQNTKDADAYFSRGLIYLDMRRFDEAISDFTRSHDLDPKNVWPLANRGLAYAWKKDTARAKQDFAAVQAIDPENKVLLHGEGLMFMSGGDLDAAVDRFTTALTRDPSDVWSMQMRADAYQQMGDFTQARADRAKLLQRLKDEQAGHSKR